MAARSSIWRRNAARALAVVAAVATGSLVAGVGPANPQAGSGEIVSPLSGLVMDVEGNSTAQGARVIQWEPNDGANQQWQLKQFGTFAGSPLVLIQSVHSSKVLDSADGSTLSGHPLAQHTWTGAPTQWWVVYRIGTSDFHLLLNVGSIAVADIFRASLDPGAPIVQWPWHGGVNQIWEIPAVIPPPTTTSSSTSSTVASTTTTAPTATTTTLPIEA